MKLARFRLDLAPTEALVLPEYKGSTFRGAFGAALKQVCCPFRYPCNGRACIIHEECIYFNDFESSIQKDRAVKPGHVADVGHGIGGDSDREMPSPSLWGDIQANSHLEGNRGPNMDDDEAIPRPFVLSSPIDQGRVFGPGDRLSVGLTLIGQAIGHFPHYLAAFDRMGEIGIGMGRGQFQVQAGFSVGLEGEGLIYEAKGRWFPGRGVWVLTVEDLDRICPPKVGCVEIRFLTPTSLKKCNQVVYVGRGDLRNRPEVSFGLLAESLLRRMNRLSALYGEGKGALDSKELIQKADEVVSLGHDLEWKSYTRYSRRQRQKHRLEGFVGRMVYAGDALRDVLPYLKFGEYVHIGKGATFGMGRYEVRVL